MLLRDRVHADGGGGEGKRTRGPTTPLLRWNFEDEDLESGSCSSATEFLASNKQMGNEWDLYKENIRPLKRDRNVNLLNEALKSHADKPLKKSLCETRRRLIEAIDEYDASAPQATTSKMSDYLRKISLKMLSVETNNPSAAPINPGMPYPAAVNQNPTDPEWSQCKGCGFENAAIDSNRNFWMNCEGSSILLLALRSGSLPYYKLNVTEYSAFVGRQIPSEEGYSRRGLHQNLLH